MKKLLLARHGQTKWNVEGRYQGRRGEGLNATGVEQARALAQSLRSLPAAKIYSSDQERARQTARIISDHCGFVLVFEPRLREISLGDWEGLLGADIQASYPQLIQQRRESPRFFRAPGDGESLEDVALRVQPALEGILNDEAENIIIVSHHVCLGVIRAILEGQPLDDVYVSQIENGVLYECRWTGTSSGCLEGRKKV